MNEQNSAVPPVEPAATPCKDRSAGLIVFGIMTILLGGAAGLLILFTLAGQMAAARSANVPPVNFSALLPAILIYGALAVALIWLGIGSIMARRWARALLLIFSWSWLALGLVVTICLACFMPKILANIPDPSDAHHALPAAAIAGIMAGTLLVFGVLFVILPAIWIFFYRSRHVKATCETRDPKVRWTDACPLPVLGFCLWLLFSVLSLLIMPIVSHGVTPFFGMFLTGVWGSIFYLAVALLWGYAAWRLYRLEPQGWWLILIAMVGLLVSSLLTYARHDITEMYQLMGYSQAQLEQMKKFNLMMGNHAGWFMSVSVLPFLVYLLCIKKYFRRRS